MVKNSTEIVASPSHKVVLVPASGQTRRTVEFRERKALENTTRWEIYTPQSVRDKVREIAKKDRISMGVAAVTLLKLGLEAYLSKNESALTENNLNPMPESAAPTEAAQELATHPVSVKDDVMSPGDAKSGSERSVGFNSMENTQPTNDPIHAELGIEDTAVKQIPEVAITITRGSHVDNIREGLAKVNRPTIVDPVVQVNPPVDVLASGNTFADHIRGTELKRV